jgi:hypothetical protein
VIARTRCHHLEPDLALRHAGCQGQTRVDHQTVPVLHQNVPQIRQLDRLAWPFAVQPGIGIGGRGMRLIAALLTAKVALAPSLGWGRLLRPGAGGSPPPSFGRKLFMLAHASISVPSPENGRPTAVP